MYIYTMHHIPTIYTVRFFYSWKTGFVEDGIKASLGYHILIDLMNLFYPRLFSFQNSN